MSDQSQQSMEFKPLFCCLLLFLPLSAFSQKPQTPTELAPSISRLEAFANRMAQQAQYELRLGKREDAFLYAEFALQYLQPDNANARQALRDAWYRYDVVPAYLSEDEKPLVHTPKTLWMPAFAGGRGRGHGLPDDVHFPWSMGEEEMSYFFEQRTGKTLQLPLRPDAPFLEATCMETGNRLLVFGNNTAQMRNRAGALLFRFEVADSLEYVQFVGNGKHLLCRKMSGPTELRDAQTGKHLLWLEKGCCSGRRLEGSDWYCSARDSVVDLFDLASGTLVRSMPGLASEAPDARDRQVRYFKASPDFGILVALQLDGTTTLFDLNTGNYLSAFSIGERAFPIDFSTNGAILGIQQIRQINGYKLHFSADLWDTHAGTRLASFDFGEERPLVMACAPLGNRVVFLLESDHEQPQRRLVAFNMQDQRPLWTLNGHYDDLLDLISHQGNLAAETFWNGDFASPAPAFGTFSAKKMPHLQFSPDGKWLCASGYTPIMTLNLFEVATGQLMLTLDTPGDQAPVFAFSPDSRSLLVGQYKLRDKMTSHAEIWNLETLSKRHDLGGQKGPIQLVAWSPDGSLALTHSAGNGLTVWDAASGQKRLEPGIPLFYPLQAGFSPDGKILAAIDTTQQLVLWSIPEGERLSHHFGEGANNQLMAFSPDGRYLATLADKILKLWNIQTGTLDMEIPASRGYLNRIWFSNDSRLLLGSYIGSTMAWEVQTGKMIVAASMRAFEFDSQNNVFVQNRYGDMIFREAFSRRETARLRSLGYDQGQLTSDGKRFASIVTVEAEHEQQSDIDPTSLEGERYFQIRLFDLDPEAIRRKAGEMQQKKALSCEQVESLRPDQYLDDSSLDTLIARILRSGDQASFRCLGSYFSQLGAQEPDLLKAQKHYIRAIRIEGTQEPSWFLPTLYEHLAERYLEVGILDSAQQYAEKALQFDPDNLSVQGTLMASQLMQGQYKKVAVRLVEYVGHEYADILNSCFHNALGRIQPVLPWHHDRARQGQIEKCIRLMAISDSISDAEAHRYYIAPPQFNGVPQETLLAELNLSDSTLAVYSRLMDSMLRAATENIAPPSAYQQSMAAFHKADYLLADSLMAWAIREIRDSLASQTEPEKVDELRGALHNQSWIAIFAQKPGVAISAALEALELNPDNTGVLTNLGHGYLFSGQFDKALETYQQYVTQESRGIPVLLADFFDLREAGIWSKDVPKILEALLKRPLTEEEQIDFGE